MLRASTPSPLEEAEAVLAGLVPANQPPQGQSSAWDRRVLYVPVPVRAMNPMPR